MYSWHGALSSITIDRRPIARDRTSVSWRRRYSNSSRGGFGIALGNKAVVGYAVLVACDFNRASCGDLQKSIVDTRCTQPTVQYGAHDFGVENSRRMSSTV